MSDEEDPGYNIQTVQDEAMLLALQLSGEGIADDEIAYGLALTLQEFAHSIEGGVKREDLAHYLESVVRSLRTESPTAINPEFQAKLATLRLKDQAEQEGRPWDRA